MRALRRLRPILIPFPAVLINGLPGNTISAEDRGFQYGDGLFETLAVLAGEPRLWSRHMQRLREGCKRLGIVMPVAELLEYEAQQLVGEADKGVLKIVVTRGVGGRGYRSPADVATTRVVSFHPWPEAIDDHDEGVRVRFCQTRLGRNPVLAGMKHLNRLEQILARAEWDDDRIAEGLMCDDRGNLIEAISSNVFLLFRDSLITPRLDECGVAGVMRGLVCDIAAEMKLDVQERQVPRAEVVDATGVFLTNALTGVRPVREVDGQRFDVPDAVVALRERVAERRMER